MLVPDAPDALDVTTDDERRSPVSSSGMAWLVAALIVGQVYYFHRWVFRYSSEGTSPTYTATPFIWQVGKYVIVGLLVAVGAGLALTLARRHQPTAAGRWSAELALVAVAMLGITLWVAVRSTSAASGQVATWFFLPIIVAMPLYWAGRRSVDVLTWTMAALLTYHILFSAYQMFAYYTQDRLPALAYAGGGLVRFGGGLDDPNGFATWLALPILVLICGWPRRLALAPRLLLLGVLGYLLIQTVSYTGFVTVCLGVAVFTLLSRRIGRTSVITVAVVIVALYLVRSGAVDRIVNFKAASANTRLSFVTGGTDNFGDFVLNLPWWGLLIGDAPNAVHTETSYLNLAAEFGLPVTIALVLLIMSSVAQGVRRTREYRAAGGRREANLYAALTGFVLAFAVGGLGVPTLEVFPTNMTFWVVAMMLWLPMEIVPDPLPPAAPESETRTLSHRGPRALERPDVIRP